MATRKPSGSRPPSDSQPLPPEEQPRPGPLPADGDGVRDAGKRAYDDERSSRKDTDEAGYDRQRDEASSGAPTRRSGRTDGSDS
jgi:hypothetical protein